MCPSQVQASQLTRCLVCPLSQVGHVSSSPTQSWPLGFPGVPQKHCLSCAVFLLWGADLRLQPSWKMSTIQYPRKTWLATGSLLTVWWRMPVSVTKIAATPCLLALAVMHLPLCLQHKGGACIQLASSALVFAQSFVLSGARLRVKAFHWKVLSLFFSPLCHSLGCYLTLAPSVCPQGIQARSLP